MTEREAARERLRQVRERFAARLRERIAELEAVIADARAGRASIGDAVAIAHRLAGTAGSFGHAQAGELAAAIEGSLQRGADDIDGLLAQLREQATD